MVPSKSRIVTVVGNIGAGKSSLTPILVDLLGAQMLDADSLFQTSDPFRELYLKDISRWAFTNELWLTNKRADLLHYQLAHLHKPWLVVDSGVLMSWVYTYSHLLVGNLTKKEWQLYDSILQKLVGNVFAQTTVIYLEYTVPTLLKRIKKRGRAFEILHYQADYLNQINQGLSALERRLKKMQIPLFKITESQIPDFVSSSKDRANLISLVKPLLLS